MTSLRPFGSLRPLRSLRPLCEHSLVFLKTQIVFISWLGALPQLLHFFLFQQPVSPPRQALNGQRPKPIRINFSIGCISFINSRRNSSFFESRIRTSYQKFAARPRVASGCRTVFILTPTSFPIRSKSAKVSIPFTLT